MTHECETKKSPIYCVQIGKDGFRCMGCFNIIKEEDVFWKVRNEKRR